jgi:monoterpene epsilon-lactone hydrolase
MSVCAARMESKRMSWRGEMVRLGLRWFVKPSGPHRTVQAARRSVALMEALVPRPPASTVTNRVDAGGVRATRVATPESQAGRVVLYLHGGGYATGSPTLYRHFTWRIASATRATVLFVEYRLAPEHPFPAAVEDAVTAYRWLKAQGAARIVVMGDSAGGGLALALLLKLRDEGLPLPSAAVVLSPWTDLALSGASVRANALVDPLINVGQATLFSKLYLSGADPRTPYASPLYGDPIGLPPTLIHVGSDEILHDDASRMADRMRAAGCSVELEVWPRMPHVWHALAPVLPEAREAIARIGTFVERNM